MKRRPALMLTGVLAVVGMAVGPSVATAGAGERSGEQTFRLTIYEVYPKGHPEGSGPIRADGVVDGKGIDQHVAPAPSDPANSVRDVLTFATGSLTVLSTGGTASTPRVDEDCHFSFKVHGLQTAVVGGAGAFAHASGHFTDELFIAGVGPRNPDGSCNQAALFDTVRVKSTGHLKL
jgi:hypothetical protein